MKMSVFDLNNRDPWKFLDDSEEDFPSGETTPDLLGGIDTLTGGLTSGDGIYGTGVLVNPTGSSLMQVAPVTERLPDDILNVSSTTAEEGTTLTYNQPDQMEQQQFDNQQLTQQCQQDPPQYQQLYQQQQQPVVCVQQESDYQFTPAPSVTYPNLGTSNNNVQYIFSPQPVVLPQQPTQVMHVSQKGNAGTIDVPALKDMEGIYGFTVSIEEKERTTKSPMWLMSKITHKLYTNINKAVPFEVRLNKGAPRDHLNIRAVAVFSSAQFLRTNVSRCPNHASTADPTNHDFPYPEHVLRADHPGAQYESNPNGRLSVIVPLDTLQDGSSYTPILLRFMCLGSCVGGINRRPIAIILTLEDSEGKIFGRKVIDVRVCACPTRDIKTDEAALTNKGPKRKSSVLQSQDKTPVMIRKKPKLVETKSEPLDDDMMFTIQVRGQKLFDFLVKMKKVYYETHPEYAAEYPDDLISVQTDEDSEDDLKSRNLQIDVGETETVNWDSGGDSPQRIVINHDPLSGTLVAKNSSPLSKLTPNITISQPSIQLRLWNDNEDVSFPPSKIVSDYIPGSLLPRDSMIINTSNVTGNSQKSDSNSSKLAAVASKVIENVNYIPKHIQVRQVPYKPEGAMVKTKVMPSLKPASAQNGGNKANKSSRKKMKESVTYSPLDSSVDTTETNYCGAFGDHSSPLSPEMLAANVLVEGFKDKHVSLQ